MKSNKTKKPLDYEVMWHKLKWAIRSAQELTDVNISDLTRGCHGGLGLVWQEMHKMDKGLVPNKQFKRIK